MMIKAARTKNKSNCEQIKFLRECYVDRPSDKRMAYVPMNHIFFTKKYKNDSFWN